MRVTLSILIGLSVAACSPNGVSNNSSDLSALGGGEPSPTATKAAEVREGPFGYDMGQAIDGLGLTKMEKPGFYQIANPPKAHADFENVIIVAYPDTGICMIRGIGKDIQGDGSGAAVRTKVDDLASALETKYGKMKKTDVCSGGDISCRGEFWMMNLNDGERFYGYTAKPSLAGSKPGVGEVNVAAQATNISTSYPVVEYASSATAACEKAEKRASASSL